MKKEFSETYEDKNGNKFTITDPNHVTLLIRAGFELVKPQLKKK